jgi:hypothetical protein
LSKGPQRAPLMEDGTVRRLGYGTSTGRSSGYGGAEGIAVCGRLFAADSDAVLASRGATLRSHGARGAMVFYEFLWRRDAAKLARSCQ